MIQSIENFCSEHLFKLCEELSVYDLSNILNENTKLYELNKIVVSLMKTDENSMYMAISYIEKAYSNWTKTQPNIFIL